jgi:hypothetical protein
MARTRAVVRNCLGLGWCGDTEVLVLLSYDRPAVPLHRPTIGDAAAYSWFRPRADPDAAHGLTEPLDPTAPGVSAHPEVVHEVTSSATLRVPVHLAT